MLRSHLAARNFRTGACGKLSVSPTTSSGPTRTCSMTSMRVGSYFEGSELAAPKALPEGREPEILNEVKDGAAGGVHRNSPEPGERHARRDARQSGSKAR